MVSNLLDEQRKENGKSSYLIFRLLFHLSLLPHKDVFDFLLSRCVRKKKVNTHTHTFCENIKFR